MWVQWILPPVHLAPLSPKITWARGSDSLVSLGMKSAEQARCYKTYPSRSWLAVAGASLWQGIQPALCWTGDWWTQTGTQVRKRMGRKMLLMKSIILTPGRREEHNAFFFFFCFFFLSDHRQTQTSWKGFRSWPDVWVGDKYVRTAWHYKADHYFV